MPYGVEDIVSCGLCGGLFCDCDTLHDATIWDDDGIDAVRVQDRDRRCPLQEWPARPSADDDAVALRALLDPDDFPITPDGV